MSKRGKELVASRPSTHGSFVDVANTIGALNKVAFNSKNYTILSPVKRAALGEIFHKTARILVGDPNHVDHWDDIGGYAQLGANDCAPAVGERRAQVRSRPVKKPRPARKAKAAKKKAGRARVPRTAKKAKTINQGASAIRRPRQVPAGRQRRQAGASRPASVPVAQAAE